MKTGWKSLLKQVVLKIPLCATAKATAARGREGVCKPRAMAEVCLCTMQSYRFAITHLCSRTFPNAPPLERGTKTSYSKAIPLMKTGYIIQLIVFLTLFCTKAAFAQYSSIQQFDDRVMIDIQNTRTPEQTDVFLFLTNTYRYGDIGIPAGLFIGGVLDHNQAMRENSAFVASSTAMSYGLEFLIKHIARRRRPFQQNSNLMPVYRAGGYSFPSGHASSTFATATALSMAYPKWYVIAPAFLWAGSVSYSRMYLGEHYPTDVAAGATLGVGSALTLSFLKK